MKIENSKYFEKKSIRKKNNGFVIKKSLLFMLIITGMFTLSGENIRKENLIFQDTEIVTITENDWNKTESNKSSISARPWGMKLDTESFVGDPITQSYYYACAHIYDSNSDGGPGFFHSCSLNSLEYAKFKTIGQVPSSDTTYYKWVVYDALKSPYASAKVACDTAGSGSISKELVDFIFKNLVITEFQMNQVVFCVGSMDSGSFISEQYFRSEIVISPRQDFVNYDTTISNVRDIVSSDIDPKFQIEWWENASFEWDPPSRGKLYNQFQYERDANTIIAYPDPKVPVSQYNYTATLNLEPLYDWVVSKVGQVPQDYNFYISKLTEEKIDCYTAAYYDPKTVTKDFVVDYDLNYDPSNESQVIWILMEYWIIHNGDLEWSSNCNIFNVYNAPENP